MYEITEKEKLAENIYMMKIRAEDVAKKAKPGQFIVLRINEEGERIPLTIADYDGKTITVVFLVVGKTTEDLSKLNKGDSLADFAGPLGKPTHIKKFGTVVLVGGGVGSAMVYPAAKQLKQAGNKVITIIGSRNKDLLFWLERFEKVSDELIVCTDDGTYGRKGLVTQPLEELLKKEKIDLVMAVGPTIMMKFVTLTAKDVPVIVSLNPIVVDGVGMCGSCRVTIGGEVKFCCVDGPEFDGHKVDWDELMNRNFGYKSEEEECRGGCKK